jgi:hypothetical protein
MLLQNLANIGSNITSVSCDEKRLSFNFTDADGNVYSGWIHKDEKEETENA